MKPERQEFKMTHDVEASGREEPEFRAEYESLKREELARMELLQDVQPKVNPQPSLKALQEALQRRKEAKEWYASYCRTIAASPDAALLTDEDVNQLVHELRKTATPG